MRDAIIVLTIAFAWAVALILVCAPGLLLAVRMLWG